MRTASSDILGYPFARISSKRSTLKKSTVFFSILVFIYFKMILEYCATSGVYLGPYQTSMMQRRSIIYIYIWQGSKCGSAVSFFNISPLWSFESVQLLCSFNVNQKYYKIFYWFPNYLLDIDHGNTKFPYTCTIETRKSLIWKTKSWNARLIYTINKNSKNNNKNQGRINKVFEKFLLSETILSII